MTKGFFKHYRRHDGSVSINPAVIASPVECASHILGRWHAKRVGRVLQQGNEERRGFLERKPGKELPDVYRR